MSILVIKNKKSNRTNYAKGFTLVELLIAISLIAVLSGVLLSVINPRGIQAKARDSQRASDLSKIKVALENYFADNRAYPYNADSVAGYVTISTFNSSLVTKYINKLPPDPKQTGTVCINTAEWHDYAYKTTANGTSYTLATVMETDSMGGACATCSVCAVMPTKGTIYYAVAD